MSPYLALFSTIFSVMLSVISITVVITQVRSNVTMLTQREISLTEKSAKTYQDLTDLLVLVKAFMAEQAVINTSVAHTLTKVVDKLDNTERRAIESGAVVQLFEELLKRVHSNPRVNIE